VGSPDTAWYRLSASSDALKHRETLLLVLASGHDDSMTQAHTDPAALLTRLRRIEGQVRGIQKMLEEDRDCMDVVTQVQAARAALAKVETEVLRRHMESCIEGAIAAGDADAQRRLLSELMAALTKSMD
jgi:CsoR family transcriptional regulator, copper-sensing transcriptional repressor